MDSCVGKTLRNVKGEEFIVLTELSCKGIPCVYAMKVEENEKEGEKQFFQLSKDNEELTLIVIKSKKMLASLTEALFEKTKGDNKPRKIEETESISEYLAYLDEFYKSKVVTIL